MLSQDQIKTLSESIIQSNDKRNYNNIIKLLQNYEEITVNKNDFSKQEKDFRYLTISLFNIFKKLFTENQLNPFPTNNEKEKLLLQWCKKVYSSFKQNLLNCITNFNFETSLSLDCLDIYMKLLELESIFFASSPTSPYFPNKTLKTLLVALINSKSSDNINPSNGHSRNYIWVEFVNSYYMKFVDIQYYSQSEFISIMTHNLIETPNELFISKWLVLCDHDNYCDSEKSVFEIFVSNPPILIENENRFKLNLESNWLKVLNLKGISDQQYKTILLILHKRIIPHLHNPANLMDFLTDSYNIGGVISLLSLNGLFELMKRYNLEYPNFYEKLYQLIDQDLIHLKYRSRFLRLTDLFLSSTHLSINLVASFIKKLARLSLNAPPSAIVSILPFIYNMLKKHPNCMIMIHNPRFVRDPFFNNEQISKYELLKSEYKDTFDINESNPELTNAINSSLWELQALTTHYHPNVSSLATIFGQPFTKLNYNLEDFLDWSYNSLLDAELQRTLKVQPSLAFDTSGDLFGDYLDNIQW